MTATTHESASPLAHLGPQWFAPVMGLTGLALAWHRATDAFGEGAAAVAIACALLAAAVFVAVLAGSVVRAIRHPKALREDLAHPVRHAFAAALPVSLILLCTDAVALLGPQPWIAVPLLGGVVLQSVVVVWVVARWLSGRKQWPGVTPVLYIPVVGNILVPLAGVPLGYPMLSWFFFGIGMFFWPVLTAMVLVRQVQQPMPERLQPSWFITVAPPAVGASAAATLGAQPPVMMAMLGVAVLCLTAAATRVPTIVRQPFAMPFWAMSFPLAAITALVLRLGEAVPGLKTPGIVMLSVVSVVIVWLVLSTIKGLRAGALLAPEPVAMIAVAKA